MQYVILIELNMNMLTIIYIYMYISVFLIKKGREYQIRWHMVSSFVLLYKMEET